MQRKKRCRGLTALIQHAELEDLICTPDVTSGSECMTWNLQDVLLELQGTLIFLQKDEVGQAAEAAEQEGTSQDYVVKDAL